MNNKAKSLDNTINSIIEDNKKECEEIMKDDSKNHDYEGTSKLIDTIERYNRYKIRMDRDMKIKDIISQGKS
jgi:hypothetical protein